MPKFLFVILSLTIFSACAYTPHQPAVTTSGGNFTFETGAFSDLFNRERTARGLGRIHASARLTDVAQGHANDMARNGFFSHTGSNGNSIGTRARRQGYGYCWIAENIWVGRKTEAEVFARWMASPGHRKNMLAPEPTEYGLAVAPGNNRVLVLGQPGC